MTAAFLAAVMWAAALACAVPTRRGRDRTVAAATTFMAIALTVTVPGIYRALDAVTGTQDVADLVKQSFFVLAVGFMARGVASASGARVPGPAVTWSVPAVVLVVQTVAFLRVEGRHGVTDFMTTYGDQPAAAVYSIAHFGWFGLVFVGAALASLRSGFRSMPPSVRTAVGILVAGCVSSVLTAALLVTRDLVRVSGGAHTATVLGRAYQPMLVLSVVLVAFGLAFPPLAGATARRRLRQELPSLVSGLGALRDRLAADDRSLLLPAGLRAPGPPPTPVDTVHRLVVEVRDQMFLHPDAVLTPAERLVLAHGEALLGRVEYD